MSKLKKPLIFLASLVAITSIVLVGAYYIFGKTQHGLNLLVKNLRDVNVYLVSATGTIAEGFTFSEIRFENDTHFMRIRQGEVKYDNVLDLLREDKWSVTSIKALDAQVKFKKSKKSLVDFTDFNQEDWSSFINNVQKVVEYSPAGLSIESLDIKNIAIEDMTQKKVVTVDELTLEGIQFLNSGFQLRRYLVKSSVADFWGLKASINSDLTLDINRKMIGRIKPNLFSFIDRTVGFDLQGRVAGLRTSAFTANLEGESANVVVDKTNFTVRMKNLRLLSFSSEAPPFNTISGVISTTDFPDFKQADTKLELDYLNMVFLNGMGDLRDATDRMKFEKMQAKKTLNVLATGIPFYYKRSGKIYEILFSPKHLVQSGTLGSAFLMRSSSQSPIVTETLSELFYGKMPGELTGAQKSSVEAHSSRFYFTSNFKTAFDELNRSRENSDVNRSTASTEESEELPKN